MSTTQAPSEQEQLWNGHAGRAWVEIQSVLDGMFTPFEARMVAEARAAGARCVLDVGCGTGATTLALARALGPDAKCLGVDISAPMLEHARNRAAQDAVPVRFALGDAGTFAFEPQSVDWITSRFGVMFFDDPVAAFANLRRAARPGAGLSCITWRSAAENPFMTTAERAAAPLLPDMPPRKAEGPGQFALASESRVREILERAGWSRVSLSAVDEALVFSASELPRYFTMLGPVGAFLQQPANAHRRQEVTRTLTEAFAPYVVGDEVRFTAACWIVRASA